MGGERLERPADQRRRRHAACTQANTSRVRQYHRFMSNIIGLGIDATDIPRIAATIERYGDRFLHRIFTEGEIAYCRGGASPPFILPAVSPPRKRR